MIPAEASHIIQHGVQDGRQNVNTPKIFWQKFSILLDISWMNIKIWPLKNDENWVISKMAAIVRENR